MSPGFRGAIITIVLALLAGFGGVSVFLATLLGFGAGGFAAGAALDSAGTFVRGLGDDDSEADFFMGSGM